MKNRAKKGCVNFLTNPKVVQAFLTGGAFAILGTGAGVVGGRLSGIVPLAAIEIKWVLIVGITAFWYWADQNQERFEQLVEEATGEDS